MISRADLNKCLPVDPFWVTAFMEDHPEWEKHRDLLFNPPSREEVEAKYGHRRVRLLDDPGYLVEYARQVREGTDPVLADMFAAQSGPGLRTETSYAPRFGTLLEQFGGDRKILERRKKAWAKKGVHVTGNEVWLPHLANAPDDVEALASPGDVLGHQKRLAEKRGIALEGAVNVKGRDPEPKKAVPLAPDIVTRIAREEAKRDPSFLESKRKKLDKYEQIVERHSLKIE